MDINRRREKRGVMIKEGQKKENDMERKRVSREEEVDRENGVGWKKKRERKVERRKIGGCVFLAGREETWQLPAPLSCP